MGEVTGGRSSGWALGGAGGGRLCGVRVRGDGRGRDMGGVFPFQISFF